MEVKVKKEKSAIYLLGDGHGNFQCAIKCAKRRPNSTIIQLGDFGIGFLNKKGELEKVPELPANFFFIGGNHENYSVCKTIPNFLGRFGIINIKGFNIFYISGAKSHDREWRTENIDWWADEELSFTEMYECLDLYEKNKDIIDVVISHDCPAIIAKTYLKIPSTDNNNTRNFLEQIYNIKNPKDWRFGHHHQYLRVTHGETEFRCLAIDMLQGYPNNIR